LPPFFLFSVSFGREAGLLINGCPPPVQHFLCDWLFLRQPLWLSLCVACHEQTPSALFLSIPLAAPEWRAAEDPTHTTDVREWLSHSSVQTTVPDTGFIVNKLFYGN
jgi:hypothetical protein